MTVVKSQKNYNTFLSRIDNSFDLVNTANDIKNTSVNRSPKLNQKQLYKIIELSFLEIFLAWEKFLENSLINYLLIKNNNNKIHCYIRPRDKKHVIEILKEGRNYADFTNTEFILRMANFYFRGGKPFSDAIKTHKSHVDDIKTIRNAITHDSDGSKEKFQKLVRENLKTLPRGVTPGSFLYGNKATTSYLEFYANILKSVAINIIS